MTSPRGTFAARNWPWVALAASAGMLAAAHAFETFGHIAPCTLCLKQREVYWGAMAVAALGGGLGITRLGSRAIRPTNAALVAVFLLGALIAFYHAGAEWKFWPGPASCSGGATHVDPAEINALMHGAKLVLPSCDRPAWVFLGFSMAGWNGLISLSLAAASTMATLRGSIPGDST